MISKISIKAFFIAILAFFLIQACKDNSSGPEPEPSVKLQVTSVEPRSGSYGTVVTIKGKGFSPDISTNKVTFSGTEAVIQDATESELRVTVPEGSASGIVRVQVGTKAAEGPTFEIFTAGALQVIVTTSGNDQDRNGYVATVDRQLSQASGLNDTLFFPEVEIGERELMLEDLDNKCGVEDQHPQLVTVSAKDTTHTTLNVACKEMKLQNQIVYRVGLHLFAIDLDGSTDPHFLSAVTGYDPAVSADGEQVGFWKRVYNDGDASNELFIVDASGYPVRQLTHNSISSNLAPSWAPDGDVLAYSAGGDITIINSDGTGLKKVTDNSYDICPSWSNDGSEIYFCRDGEIFKTDTEGTFIQQVTDDEISKYQIEVAPDGNRITFSGYIDNQSPEIYVMNTDGSDIKKLIDRIGYYPTWSPDGDKIAFQGYEDGNPEIFIINADGSELINLTNTPFTNELEPSWSKVQ